MIECGRSVDVKDATNAHVVRFIAQCGGRFLCVTNYLSNSVRNGYMLADWHGVARELVALTVPASMKYDKGLRAESQVGGMYNDLWLTYPLSVKGLADLLGEDVDAVRELLADLAVPGDAG